MAEQALSPEENRQKRKRIASEEAAYVAGFESSAHKAARRAAGTILLLLCLVSFWGIFRLPSYLDDHNGTRAADPNAQRASVGFGRVLTCDRRGPIGRFFVGDGWTCAVRAQMNKDDEPRAYNVSDEFRPSDKGSKISVIRTRVVEDRNGNYHLTIQRNLERPLAGWATPSVFVCIALSLLFFALGFGRLMPYERRLQIYDNERRKLRDKCKERGLIPPDWSPGDPIPPSPPTPT